jgi:hypothetical protein
MPKDKKEFHVGSFSGALELLKQGRPVYRKIWEEGTFLYLVHGSTFMVSKEPLLSLVGPVNVTFSSQLEPQHGHPIWLTSWLRTG